MKMQDRPTFGALSKQGLCPSCSVENTTKNLSENKFSNKKHVFGLRRKHLSYNFHLWENVYHRVFIKFSVLMELHENKFPIYENCMISTFGQPGILILQATEAAQSSSAFGC